MSVNSPLNCIYEHYSNPEDDGITKRSVLFKSFEGSVNSPSTQKKMFIPFLQERDALGRLIKLDDSKLTVTPKAKYLTPKTGSYSALVIVPPIQSHIEKLPPITPHYNSNTLKRMMENTLQTEVTEIGEESTVIPTPIPSYTKLSANLYRVWPSGNNALEVEGTPRKETTNFKVSPRGDIVNHLVSDGSVSVRTEVYSMNKHNKSRVTLPIVHGIDGLSGGIISSFASARSIETKVSQKTAGREHSYDPAEASSLTNPTVWRYEATQMAQNKDVQNMLKMEEKRKMSKPKRLTKPHKVESVPPIGIYDPSFQPIEKRQQNCRIFPESPKKIKDVKTYTEKQKNNDRENQKTMPTARQSYGKEDDYTSDNEYYRNCLKACYKRQMTSKRK